MGEVIKIKYLTDIEPISQKKNSDWIDLRCAVDTFMKAGDYVNIPLGVAMELPEGYEALVIPRSSTFKNFGILMANSTGLIDCSYRSDSDQWHFPALAIRDTAIKKNDRICQFRIQRNMPDICFRKVEKLGNTARGGFGSTGVQ